MSVVSTSKKEKVPVIYIELCDRRGSGFILDGTEGSKYETELNAPSARFIPNIGYRAAKDNDGTVYHEEIAYRKNQREISVDKLRSAGVNINGRQTKEDKIIIEKGYLSVAREGKYIGLYDYLKDAFYREDAPNRPETLDAIYRVIELDKKSDEFNDSEIIASDALQYIKKLFQEAGVKDGVKQYKYKEDRINTLCELFAVFAETPSGKIQSLIGLAKKDPKVFLDKVSKYENNVNSLIAHALQLNVIRFKDSNVEYVDKDKVIHTFSKTNLAQEKKLEELGNYLQTSGYAAKYEELKIEVDAAKEKNN